MTVLPTRCWFLSDRIGLAQRRTTAERKVALLVLEWSQSSNCAHHPQVAFDEFGICCRFRRRVLGGLPLAGLLWVFLIAAVDRAGRPADHHENEDPIRHGPHRFHATLVLDGMIVAPTPRPGQPHPPFPQRGLTAGRRSSRQAAHCSSSPSGAPRPCSPVYEFAPAPSVVAHTPPGLSGSTKIHAQRLLPTT